MNKANFIPSLDSGEHEDDADVWVAEVRMLFCVVSTVGIERRRGNFFTVKDI